MLGLGLRLRVLGGLDIFLRRRAVCQQFPFPRQAALRQFQIAFGFSRVRLRLAEIRRLDFRQRRIGRHALADVRRDFAHAAREGREDAHRHIIIPGESARKLRAGGRERFDWC